MSVMIAAVDRRGIHTALLSSDLETIETHVAALPNGMEGRRQQLVWTGAQYVLFAELMTGSLAGKVHTVTFSREGKPASAITDIGADLPAPFSDLSDVTSNQSTILMTMRKPVHGYLAQAVATRINPSTLATLGSAVLSIEPAHQSPPKVASDGFGFFAVWREALTLKATILGQNGYAVVEPIKLAGLSATPTLFAVAYGADQYLVLWVQDRRLSGVRVHRSGVPIDVLPFVIASEKVGAMAVAWTGNEFLVAWSAHGDTPAGKYLYTAVVETSGIVTAPQEVTPRMPDLELSGWPIDAVDVATDGRVAVLGFQIREPVYMPIQRPRSNFGLTKLTPRGTPADRAAVLLRPLGEGVFNPSIAANAHGFIAVHASPWQDGGHVTVTPLDVSGSMVRLLSPSGLFEWPYAELSMTAGEEYFDIAMRYVSHFPEYKAFVSVSRVDAAGRRVSPVLGARVDPSFTLGELSDTRSDTRVIPAAQATWLPLRPRAVVYLHEDFAPLPAPPRAPVTIVSTKHPCVTTWQDTSDDELGFLIESSFEAARSWSPLIWAPANATAAYPGCSGSSIRVRAWNAGGLSESNEVLVRTNPRRRAVGP